MSTLVCLLEERSAEEMLNAVLPKILPEDMKFKLISFEGKQDLERRLVQRIRHWQAPDSWFLVMRDKDSDDCIAIKNRLEALVAQTGKKDKTLIRIACCELESFYLGDLAAVEKGFSISGCSCHQNKKKFRRPDTLNNAAQELKKITGCSGKIGRSRDIAPYLALDGSNKSHSFNVLIAGIRKMVKECCDVTS